MIQWVVVWMQSCSNDVYTSEFYSLVSLLDITNSIVNTHRHSVRHPSLLVYNNTSKWETWDTQFSRWLLQVRLETQKSWLAETKNCRCRITPFFLFPILKIKYLGSDCNQQSWIKFYFSLSSHFLVSDPISTIHCKTINNWSWLTGGDVRLCWDAEHCLVTIVSCPHWSQVSSTRPLLMSIWRMNRLLSLSANYQPCIAIIYNNNSLLIIMTWNNEDSLAWDSTCQSQLNQSWC